MRKARRWRKWVSVFDYSGTLSCLMHDSREEAEWVNRLRPGEKSVQKIIPVLVTELPRPKARGRRRGG